MTGSSIIMTSDYTEQTLKESYTQAKYKVFSEPLDIKNYLSDLR